MWCSLCLVVSQNYGCPAAQALTVGSSVTGDTSLANPYLVGPTASSCEGSYNYDDDVGGVLWYSVQVATEQAVVVSTCSGTTNFDTRFSVMTSGTSGCLGTLSCIRYASGGCSNQLGSLDTFVAQPGVTYYIAVYGTSGSSGTFELTVSDGPSVSAKCVFDAEY